MIQEPIWTCDGEEIAFSGWSASASLGGYDRASGRVTAAVASVCEQGSILTAWVNGQKVWEGRVTRPPLAHRGSADLEAQGLRVKAEKATGRLLYQSRDVSLGAPRSGPPWNNAGVQELIGVENQGSSVLFKIEQGQVVAVNQYNGMVFPFPKTPGGLSRIQFDWRSNAATTALDLKLWGGTYPSDSWTLIATVSLNATSGAVNQASTAGYDMIMLEVLVTTGFTSSGYSLLLFNMRFDGIASSDTFTTSQVVSDIAGRLGFNTAKIQSSGVNALPLDIQGGDWMSEGFFYMALLDDWAPPFVGAAVTDGGTDAEVRYDKWGARKWNVSFAADAEPELVALELFNKVKVSYPSVGGFPAEVLVTADDIDVEDPLAAKSIENIAEESLSDPQPDALLATSVGQSLLRRIIAPRYAGRLTVAGASDQAGLGSVWDILPGDHINVQDWGPAEARELPVYAVEWSEGQPAAIGIEAPASAGGIAARAALQQTPFDPSADLAAWQLEAWQAGREAELVRMELATQRKEWRREKRQAFREHTRKTSPGGRKVTRKEQKARRRWLRENPRP